MNQEAAHPLRHPQVNQFLQKLESALSHVSVSDRAEILTSVIKQIQEKIAQQQPVDQILQSLGDPYFIAQKEVSSRSIPFNGNPGKSTTKKLFLGSIIAFLLIIGGASWFISTFFPIFKMDEKEQRIELFGGRFQFDLGDSTSYSFQTNQITADGEKFGNMKGQIPKGDATQFSFKGINGVFAFRNHDGESIVYDCEYKTKDALFDQNAFESFFIKEGSDEIKFSFDEGLLKIRCDFDIPNHIDTFSAEITNGKLDFYTSNSSLKGSVSNGQIRHWYNPNQNYSIKTDIQNGAVRGNEALKPGPNSKSLDFSVINGNIEFISEE